MKFGKSLSNQIEETLPEWRDKFLSYKGLKKKIKLIQPKAADAVDGGGEQARKRQKVEVFVERDSWGDMSKEEIDFAQLLQDEIDKFNAFFVEKEEEYIIRLKDLQDRAAKVEELCEEMIQNWKDIVDLHGEMVLLFNYSALNYTGLVKILKKYDKRTGALVRSPFLQKVLQEPFLTIDMLNNLVRECERMLDHLFPPIEAPCTNKPADKDVDDDGCDPTTTTTTNNDGQLRVPGELSEIKHVESLYVKSTIAALRALQEIRSGSSTVNQFSLPPLKISGLEDSWKKEVPVMEQAAK